jgi:hypothetical protein|tara:strand:+ start:1611 stop:1901 length:291 start_codon:yes stop_codon:yes gene_type:complete
MIEVLLVIFIITSGVLGYVVYRSLGRLSFYEDMYGDMYQRFYALGEDIRSLLGKEIYSRDPVVANFVERLQEIEHYIQQLDENYKFNLLGEDMDES